MRIQTLSIVAGSEACNARCPYCVARMTPDHALDGREPQVNWRNLDIACRFAKQSGVSTVLVTGKGEPTLFPQQITRFLTHIERYGFPFIELQTNGIALDGGEGEASMRTWYDQGLTMVAISIVHHDPERNRAVFLPRGGEPLDLAALVERIHRVGLSVRLSCTMLAGQIDSAAAIEGMVDFARHNSVEQLTLRPVEAPASSRDDRVAAWVEAHRVPRATVEALRDRFDEQGTRLMELAHGAIVYDYRGQNVCLSNCLTLDPSDERIRQLIFFPDGHLRYDWQYAGAVLL